MSIMDDNPVRDRWMFGCVVSTHPGRDGVVRAVTVCTADGKERDEPVSRVCLLEAHADFAEIQSPQAPIPAPALTEPAL